MSTGLSCSLAPTDMDVDSRLEEDTGPALAHAWLLGTDSTRPTPLLVQSRPSGEDLSGQIRVWRAGGKMSHISTPKELPGGMVRGQETHP
jgi:hypothetical protein